MRVDLPNLMLMARGRWAEVLAAAGMPVDRIENRRGRPCPKCGGRDRFGAFAGFAERGVVFCRHCFNKSTNPRPGDGLSSLRWWLGVDAAGAIQWLARFLGVDHGVAVPRPVEHRVPIERPEVDGRWAELADRWFSEMPRVGDSERLNCWGCRLNRCGVWVSVGPSCTIQQVGRCVIHLAKWLAFGCDAPSRPANGL